MNMSGERIKNINVENFTFPEKILNGKFNDATL
jgi:hypothetical protein